MKVYPVDLMRLYLTRRNLDAIAGIDLAGIKPFYSATIKLGDGQDFDDKVRAIDFPVKREGAYLVMVRGDDRYASGILLVSPLELQVLEEADSGRVRVTVRDARTKALVPKVQVKVIGSGNGSFFSGETDLRGVFVAEGVRGQVTAVARKGSNQYAFHRGTTPVGPPPAAPNAPGQGQAAEAIGPRRPTCAERPGPELFEPDATAPAAGGALQGAGQWREGEVGVLIDRPAMDGRFSCRRRLRPPIRIVPAKGKANRSTPSSTPPVSIARANQCAKGAGRSTAGRASEWLPRVDIGGLMLPTRDSRRADESRCTDDSRRDGCSNSDDARRRPALRDRSPIARAAG